ncbi:MAG: hypothetical protein [Cressdnaviricota sp.]|nr:MAG: hypothetical protein [Cressdnaviricota sp.]
MENVPDPAGPGHKNEGVRRLAPYIPNSTKKSSNPGPKRRVVNGRQFGKADANYWRGRLLARATKGPVQASLAGAGAPEDIPCTRKSQGKVPAS